jgi:hypothetical protein
MLLGEIGPGDECHVSLHVVVELGAADIMSLTASSRRRTRKHRNLLPVACLVLTHRRCGVLSQQIQNIAVYKHVLEKT